MQSLSLWYRQPATRFVEALPVGNGRLGAMVYGGIVEERISLNDDTLWSGGPTDGRVPGARAVLPQVRAALLREDYLQAAELCKGLQGAYSQAYLPMGELRLRLAHADDAGDYTRELDLTQAVAGVRYRVDGVTYTRQCFVSAPGQLLVLRCAADAPGQISLCAQLDSRMPSTVVARDGDLLLTGRAALRREPGDDSPNRMDYAGGEAVTFAMRLHAEAVNGRVWCDAEGMHVDGADSVVLYLAADTSFNGFANAPNLDPARDLARRLADAAGMGFAAVLAAHRADYQALFTRCALELGTDAWAELPTDARLRRYTGADDPALATLLFQYGRYLLIACSRPGTRAANLQGIWNEELPAPWSSNYTVNINTEMNYWPAEPTNLGECAEPLFRLIEALTQTGAVVARENYGCRGWVTHHNSDLWAMANPVGDFGNGSPTWSCWPMGAGWLSQHLWEHFAFTRDQAFLRRVWPWLRDAAAFYLDWLQPFTADGRTYLGTMPATSPENEFTTPDGIHTSVSIASTMDMAIIYDLFTNCLAAARELGVDDEATAQIRAARGQLYPPHIGQYGQLQEWYKDWDNPEDHHRHVSHLFGLHPGRQITPEDTPALFAAARRTLELRGDDGTGWSLAWKVNFWARLREGDHALHLIHMMLRLVDDEGTNYAGGGGVYPNLLDAHPPFQIDGNFGVTAGIVEMLLQSHRTVEIGGETAFVLHLLPALPTAWPTGRVRGLRARGGATVDIAWEQGALSDVVVHADAGGRCVLHSACPLAMRPGDAGALRDLGNGMWELTTVPGEMYVLRNGAIAVA